MAERANQKRLVTFEELLRACLYEQEPLRRVLVRKGLLTNEEVLEEVKAAAAATKEAGAVRRKS